jgi:hypothetical protein
MTIKCGPGVGGDGHTWIIDFGPPKLFATMHSVIIIMWSMAFYIVFFTIPFRYNRIKKNKKEVSFSKN